MRINRLALRKLVLREMHDHMDDEDVPVIDAEIIDDEGDDEEEHEENEPDETEVDEEGDFDYEDSDVYEETGMIKSNLFMLAKKSMELHDEVGDGDDLPEWVQEKIAVCDEYIDVIQDYLKYEYKTTGGHLGRSKSK